jgi:hypothetical protein
MALKAIVATLVLGTSSLALAETPREARVDERGLPPVGSAAEGRRGVIEHRRSGVG